MRKKLIQYVELLFAGAPNSEEIKQEILQNTLDRFDDLISQGKQPEAAYRLAISGIGDISEILGSDPQQSATPVSAFKTAIHDEVDSIQKKKIRAVAVAMYILCPIPLFVFTEFGQDTLGLCFTLLLVAAATALIIMTQQKDPEKDNEKQPSVSTPQQELKDSVDKLVGAIGLALYLIISFTTQAWYITWLVFPIMGCVKGLCRAIMDLKEACRNEN